MMRKGMTGLVLCGLLALATAGGAHAQGLGGLIKKAVQKKGQDAKASDPSHQGVQFNERVVELTEPVLKGLLKGLDVEIALLTDFGKLLATYSTSEQYDKCKTQVATSPEYQKIILQVTLPENPTMEQMQRASEKMTADMDALLKKTCGANITEEWPDYKRMQKVGEIHQQAAAAAGLLLSSPPPQQRGGPAIDDATAELAQQQGSTDPYDIAQERFDAYCKYKKVAAPGIFPLNGNNLAIKASIIDPSNANLNVYWQYTPDEAAAIDPKCNGFTLQVGKIITLMDEIRIVGKVKR